MVIPIAVGRCKHIIAHSKRHEWVRNWTTETVGEMSSEADFPSALDFRSFKFQFQFSWKVGPSSCIYDSNPDKALLSDRMSTDSTC
jgi:hypothetical protein